jgi:general secretion pathway protein B
MSFILDALRKSEIERQRQSGPSMAEFPVARTDRRLPVALIAIGFLLAVNLAVVLYFMLRDSRAPEAAAAPAMAAAASSAASDAPAAEIPPPTTGNAPEILVAPIDEFANEPAQTFGGPATEPPDAPDPTLIPDTPVSGPGVTYSEGPPTPLDNLAAQGSSGLPELSVDLHIYTDDPAKRAVFINGRRYVQGARIKEGPMVEEITREGAVLSYHGRRFLLPRL